MRSARAAHIALASAALAFLAALLLALAPSAGAAGTTTVIHFTPESLAALEGQLHKHEVHALTFHPTPEPGHVHVSMNDGTHYTVVYSGAAEQEHLIAVGRADGSSVTVATVKAKTKTATHHKLRYIAAGILIVVIVIVAAVLLIDRRRKLREETGEGASGTAG